MYRYLMSRVFCWRNLDMSCLRMRGSCSMVGDSTGRLSMSLARAYSWTRSRSSMACCWRLSSLLISREKRQPRPHMTTVTVKHAGPMICRGSLLDGTMLLNPNTVKSTPMMKNATDRKNMHRPTVSSVVQRRDMETAPRESLFSLETEERDPPPAMLSAEQASRARLLGRTGAAAEAVFRAGRYLDLPGPGTGQGRERWSRRQSRRSQLQMLDGGPGQCEQRPGRGQAMELVGLSLTPPYIAHSPTQIFLWRVYLASHWFCCI